MSNLTKRTLTEIVKESIDTQSVESLNHILNKAPRPNWVKKHPFATKEIVVNGQKVKMPTEYLSVARLETLLTQIFQQWQAEIVEYKQLANAITVHVRVHYLHPVTQKWMFQDGLGAVDIQVKKDSSPADLANINANAIQKGLPAAESYAFKDAVQKLGKLFGRDLNRTDAPEYTSAYSLHPDWNPEIPE